MNWHYISGFVDADGSITLIKQKGRYYPRIGFHNTCLEILVQIEKFIKLKLNINGTLTHYLPRTDEGEVQYTLTYSSYKSVLPILARLTLKHPKKMYRVRIIDKVNKARLGDTTIDYEETAQQFRSDSWKYLVGI